MRRLTRIVILVAVAVLCALWSPWNSLGFGLNDLLGAGDVNRTANLQVSSLAGEMLVYLDDSVEPIATVNLENSPYTIPGIEVGAHQIRLERVSEVENAYWVYNKIINFVPNLDVILAYELGPTEEFSGGHLIYAQERDVADDGLELSVATDVEEATVLINDAQIGEAPISGFEITLDAQQRISLVKPGYDSQEFLLLPETQEDRDRLAGFSLFVEVDLFLQPLAVEDL